MNSLGGFVADGKSPISATACSHDEGEEGRRRTESRKTPPTPAGKEDEDLAPLHLQRRAPRLHGEDGAHLAVAEKEPEDQNSKTRSPSPAQRPRTETAQTEGSSNPRPPEVERATARSRRTPSQKGKLADTTHHTGDITASTTPPAGTKPNPTPTLYTHRTQIRGSPTLPPPKRTEKGRGTHGGAGETGGRRDRPLLRLSRL
jgi:hypothetical protein